MKNYLKFVVAVFGITVATFGSINANAKASAIRCKSGSTEGCARVEGGGWIVGIRENI
jgi:hypothetical protein